MIKSLRDARITDGLPRVVARQDWVQAFAEALGVVHSLTMDYAQNSQIYTAIDTTPEVVLDALAVNWKIDWYDTGFSIEQKRRIVKTAMDVRRTMGTAYATRLQADAIYPGTMVEEWFEYQGEAGTFRLCIDVTGSTATEPVEAAPPDEMEERLTMAKRWSAHMESLSYMVRHRLKTRCTVNSWLTEQPVCGLVRCGEVWMQSTLGWSEQRPARLLPMAEPFAISPDLTGTLPEVAALGASIGAAAVGACDAAGFAVPLAQCGVPCCGAVSE
jgi:phage tail P2-like protein